MTTRTTKSTVTFQRPFRLDAFEASLPPGRYSIETDEELIDGVSFPAYRRTAIVMQLIPDPSRVGITESVMINPLQLEELLAADAAQERNISIDPPKVDR